MERRLPLLPVIAVMIATAILLACTAPTFDLDEALYRRIAEEMKGGSPVSTWDGRVFFEKPPTYVWTIVLASRIVDGATPHVSIFASRLPSLLFSIATVVLLALFWRRAGPRFAGAMGLSTTEGRACDHAWLLSPLLPVVAFGAGLLPLGGSASVLLDPMLTLCLTVALLVFTAAWLRADGERLILTLRETLLAGAAMAGATAIKGLVGLVLPAFALLLHAVLTRPRVRTVATMIRATAPAFILAVVLGAGFFAALSRSTGTAFLYEFFIHQHFGRGTSAMQGHRGPVLYHIGVILLLGGALVGCVLAALARLGRGALPYRRWGFPLSWAAAVVLFFSAMATKLPNYTWPVWPALALALPILLLCISAAGESGPARNGMRRFLRGAGYAIAIPTPLLLLAAVPGAERVAGWLSHGARTQATVAAIAPFPVAVRIGAFVVAAALLLQCLELRRFTTSLSGRAIARAALLNCVILIAASVAIVPYLDDRLHQPLVRLSHVAMSEHVPGGELTTLGLFSPTVSSNFDAGPVRQIGTPDDATFAAPRQHLVLVPSWRANVCRTPGFSVVRRDEFLLLCAKPALPAEKRAGNVSIVRGAG